jgi:two-component system response regulator NreC
VFLSTDFNCTPDSENKIRCLLFHDHVLLRQGLRRLLEDEPDIDVVAEADTAAECLRKVEELRPAVVLACEDAFDSSTQEAVLRITQSSPQTKIIFLSSREHNTESFDATNVAAGSSSSRRTSAENLLAMLRTACGVYRPDRRQNSVTSITPFPAKNILTAREREVLKLLAEGKTVRAAASILGVSVKTVDAHKFNLMRKLGIHNKAELVMFAIQKNVVKVPVNF